MRCFVIAVASAAFIAIAATAGSAGAVFDVKPPQSLFVYNTGVPGSIPGEYARYSIPNLQLQETTIADGVGSPIAFGKHKEPFFVDEGTSAFGLFEIPSGTGAQPGVEQFSGIPCVASSLATHKADYFVVQYCSTNVLEYSDKTVQGGGPKSPIASFTGGNLGSGGVTNPTYAAVDKNGNLYVGDNGGGVTYFAKGSTTGAVAFPTGMGGFVNQMVVDKNGDVWSIHGPDATKVYFSDETHCVLDPSGSVIRFELGERFSNGTLVQHLYSGSNQTSYMSADGLSIAVDSKFRVYAGVGASNNTVVLDYEPGASCPNDALAIVGAKSAYPQVNVDAQRNVYVTDYIDNMLFAYRSATTSPIMQIAQPAGLINIATATVGP